LKTQDSPPKRGNQSKTSSQITSIQTQTSSNTGPPQTEECDVQQQPPNKFDGRTKYYLALTFIGTLLSSQRTRAHRYVTGHLSGSLRGNRSKLSHPISGPQIAAFPFSSVRADRCDIEHACFRTFRSGGLFGVARTTTKLRRR